MRGLSYRKAGREKPLLRICHVLLILPNELRLGLATDEPKVLKDFFCCMDELSGLLMLHGIERRACAGFCSLETPLAAPFRSRVLSGRNWAFVVTLCKKERDVMMLCESSVPRMILVEVDEQSVSAQVTFRATGVFASPEPVMRSQRRSISAALSVAHATKPVFDSLAAAIPGTTAAIAKTKRNNTIIEELRIVRTFYY